GSECRANVLRIGHAIQDQHTAPVGRRAGALKLDRFQRVGAHGQSLMDGARRQHPIYCVRLEDVRLNAGWQARGGVARGDHALDPPGGIRQHRQGGMHTPHPGWPASFLLKLAPRQSVSGDIVWLEWRRGLSYRTRSAKRGPCSTGALPFAEAWPEGWPSG